MKRYIKLSIIRKLPLFVVLSVLLLTVAFTSATNVEFHVMGSGEYRYTPYPTSAIGGVIGVFFVIMMFLPFFSMNYRYSLAKSDLYRQVAFKDNRIRIGEHLSSLIIMCAAFTVAFSLLVSVLAIRNYGNFETGEVAFYLHYEWYIPTYFVAIIVGAAQYFISYLLISRSNTFINSLLMLILGELALNFCVYVFACFILADLTEGTVIFGAGPSVVGAIHNVNYYFELFITEGTKAMKTIIADHSSGDERPLYITSFILVLVQFFVAATLGLVAFIKEKDPSSEWAGKPDTDKPYQEIIFHVGFAVIGLAIGSAMMESFLHSIFAILYFTIYVVCYYTLYGLLHRNFKLKGYQGAIIFGIAGFDITFSLIYAIILFYVSLAHGM